MCLLAFSCDQRMRSSSVLEKIDLDIQGHRGARGLLPENSILGFMHALELGVNTLELDLVVTRDHLLLVSHDPFFSSEFCLDSSGNRVTRKLMKNLNIYQMTYEEIQCYDCGSMGHPRFPYQRKIKVQKPLLSDVFNAVESAIKEKGYEPVRYNVELKTRKEWDGRFHPSPSEFSELVYQAVTKAGLWSRVNIQSFDFRTLQYFHEKYPHVRLSLLIENNLNWKINVDSLKFTPDIYSCDYQLLSRDIIVALKKEGMLVIPWTVNDTNDMKKLIDWGVDGLITDYPDRVFKIHKN